jgi:signal transduction histidine kinase/CheY-like chemotaxis protein
MSAVTRLDVPDDRLGTRRAQALIELNDRIQATDDPIVIATIAGEILGSTLEVSRAGYGTIDTEAETVVIEADWNAEGVSSIAGTLMFRDYGSYIDDLKRGETATVTDADSDLRTKDNAAALAAISARSFINMPVTELGRFVALIFVNQAEPRSWTAAELAFVREVGHRTRTAIERRRAEAALLDSQRRLGTALAIAKLGICEWDLATDRLDIDKRTREIFGFGDEPRTAAELFARIHPGDLERVRAVTTAAIANPGRLEAEYRIVLPGGETRTVISTNDFKFGKDGTAERTVGVFEDVTGRRRVEAELRALNETLEARVAERTAELETAQEALRQSQKLEAIGQLTGGVAHDFNNLLTVIGGSADLLRRPNLTEDRRARYVEAIISTVERAAKLTAQLLAFARRQSLKPEIADARQKVSAVAAGAAGFLGVGVQIETHLPEAPAPVDVDLSQLDIALLNLVKNAGDAMNGAGTLRLNVTAVDGIPALRGHSFRPGRFVAISVADTGRGIRFDNRSRIFEPFYSTKAHGQGSGLGLSQVFGFARQSGGDISVSSDEGHGANFTLYLPRVDASETPRHAPARGSAGGEARGCILVVDDNPDVREFAVHMLVELGYETVQAEDGPSALATLAQDSDRFGLVFSDVMMPGMTGIELGHEIRRLYANLPVVLASGYSDALAEHGAIGFELLGKPYTLDHLSRTLSQSFRQQR